jgi:hypothetical protein
MFRMPSFPFLRRAALAFAFALAALPATAQEVPDAFTQEVLIKSTLLTFNDANTTGEYDVLHAKSAKPFQETFTTEQIAEMFKAFREQEIDFFMVTGMDYVEDAPPEVSDKGILTLKGHFPTTPSAVEYSIEFVLEDGDWKMIGINVNVG